MIKESYIFNQNTRVYVEKESIRSPTKMIKTNNTNRRANQKLSLKERERENKFIEKIVAKNWGQRRNLFCF